MRVQKYVAGFGCVELELEEIKKYPRYSLYQVYKIVGDSKVPLYQECFTKLQIKTIILRNYKICEVAFE